MSLDFQDIQNQIQTIGGRVSQFRRERDERLARAQSLLETLADRVDPLREQVLQAAGRSPTLRCARPESERLTARFALPEPPDAALILAADGSQIAPDRHLPVEYYLINVGVIELQLGKTDPPETHVRSQLHFGAELLEAGGRVTEGQVTLERDLAERQALADLAPRDSAQPVITLTDGTLELWGAKEGAEVGAQSFRQSLERYKQSLRELHAAGAATAGYVDRPRADLVVRLLEVASQEGGAPAGDGLGAPFLGVSDLDLFQTRLAPGERSAVFGLQSQSFTDYTEELALHFFYLNVGRPERPWIARVEAPAWVVNESARLNALHGVLVGQCRILGNQPFPYLLHRAHEAAVVTRQEKDQITRMIMLELHRQGEPVGWFTYKQSLKESTGRTRYRG